MIDTDSFFFKFGLVVAVSAGILFAVLGLSPREPVVAEKTYLTKVVPHIGAKWMIEPVEKGWGWIYARGGRDGYHFYFQDDTGKETRLNIGDGRP